MLACRGRGVTIHLGVNNDQLFVLIGRCKENKVVHGQDLKCRAVEV